MVEKYWMSDKKIKFVNRKSMPVRYSGRSSDYITPTFGHGCLYKCSYCYMRRNVPDGLSIAKNTDEIIDVINNHVEELPWLKQPNQTHEKFYTYDFSCNEDYVLHTKYHEWEKLFDFFKLHPKIMGTAATKYVNKKLLSYNADGKVRIRFSLVPENMQPYYEPNTSSIPDRINAINEFIEAGYDVHVNFSPIIVTPKFIDNYVKLFKQLDDSVSEMYKKNVKAEAIFLTHNEKMHEYNVANEVKYEEYLWNPKIQEQKTSTYGGKNVRYRRDLKSEFINQFKQIHKEHLPWQQIRYIF
jgi:spore photoproduct lyase